MLLHKLLPHQLIPLSILQQSKIPLCSVHFFLLLSLSFLRLDLVAMTAKQIHVLNDVVFQSQSPLHLRHMKGCQVGDNSALRYAACLMALFALVVESLKSIMIHSGVSKHNWS